MKSTRSSRFSLLPEVWAAPLIFRVGRHLLSWSDA